MVAKSVILFVSILYIPLTASAQDIPKLDIFLGYSYVRADLGSGCCPIIGFDGVSLSIAYNINRFLGIVGDVGNYRESIYSSHENLFSFMLGPRFSYRGSSKVTPYVQVLLGGTRYDEASFTSNNSFAMTVGGGVDINLTDHISLRSLQAEYFFAPYREEYHSQYLPNFFSERYRQNHMRLSTGVVFRLGK